MDKEPEDDDIPAEVMAELEQEMDAYEHHLTAALHEHFGTNKKDDLHAADHPECKM